MLLFHCTIYDQYELKFFIEFFNHLYPKIKHFSVLYHILYIATTKKDTPQKNWCALILPILFTTSLCTYALHCFIIQQSRQFILTRLIGIFQEICPIPIKFSFTTSKNGRKIRCFDKINQFLITILRYDILDKSITKLI